VVRDLVERGDPRHQAGDLGADLAVQLGEGTSGAGGRVVQQRRTQHLVAGAEPARIVATASRWVIYGLPLKRVWP